jgi:hypothetical protein
MNTPRNPEFEISLEDEDGEPKRPACTATTSPPAPTVTTSPC